jgi:acyl transferase domain-containing protein
MKAITSRLVFLFPGQGSYNPALLQEMHDQFPGTRFAFAEADRICQRFLGYKVTPVFTAGSTEEHDRLANECPDVDQVGIFLASYLVAQAVRDSGIQPDLMLGHSFGEIAALASAGVFPLSTGLKIVCQRILSLQGFARDGRMMAVSCEANRVSVAVQKLHRSGPSIAVINHPRQTVVSGTAEALEALSLEMNRAGVSTTILKARYPFHSPLLTACVQPFRLSLEAHEFSPPRIPVYLGV